MPTISRHTFDKELEEDQKFLKSTIKKEDEELRGAFTGKVTFPDLTNIYTRSLRALPYRSILNPEDPKILADLRRIACAAAGIFATSAKKTGAEITIPAPDGGECEAVSAGFKPSTATGKMWSDGFFAAVAAREIQAREVLAQVSAATIRRGEGTRGEYFYAIQAGLQALVLDRADVEKKLLAASEEADPDKYDADDRDVILDTWWPIADVAVRMYVGEQDKFDKAMVNAVKGHKHFYEKGAGKPYLIGMIALKPLAMAVWGKQFGLKTTVESEYMPRSIIDRK